MTDDLGFSQKTTVLILYAASIILGIMSIIMARTGMQNILVLLISLAIVLIAVIAFIYRPSKHILEKASPTEDAVSESTVTECVEESVDDE